MISDQSVRESVIHDHDTLFAVDAGAGTGKTTLLVSRLIALLLEKQAPLSRIAAITFTEKAAAELAERLRSKLEEALGPVRPASLAQGDQSQEAVLARKTIILKALEDMERAPISTIHSFCAGLLREYPVEARVDPQFTLMDEVQSGAFENQAWDHWLKKNLAKPVEPLFQFLRLGGTFEHLDELKQFLKRNRTLLSPQPPKPLPSVKAFRDQWTAFVAMTKREAAQCAKHEDTLYEALEAFWSQCEAIEGDAKDIDFALANLKVPKVGNKGAQGNWGKDRLAALRDGFVRLADDHTKAFAPFKEAIVLNLVHWIGDYLKEWEEKKAQGGFLDFDDLLLKTRDLLRDHPEAREEIKGRLDYLFVDEFQDTDPLQVEIVFFLCEAPKRVEKNWKKVQLEPGKLFLVGDPKQSIYRFRRADVAIYEATKERIVANGGKVEILTENFRTVGGLVEWVNDRFTSQFEGTGIGYSPLNASREKGKTEGTLPILWGMKIPVPKEEKPSKALLRQLEAEAVATFLREHVLGGGFTVSDPKTHEKRPVRKGDIAILFRDLSNDNEEFWEEALRKRDLAYQIVGGKRFYNRPEIVALSTLLTCLSSPADEAACVAVLRGPLFGFSDEELFLHRAGGGSFHFLEHTKGKVGEAFRFLREWLEATRTLGVSDTLAKLYESTDLLAITAGQPHGEQRVANLMKVLDQARELETSQHFTYRAFVKWLTTQQEEGTMEGEAPGPDSTEDRTGALNDTGTVKSSASAGGLGADRITLMTIHKAKGLEFPLVFVSGIAADPKDSGSLVDRKHLAGAFKVGKVDLGLKTMNYDAVQEEEENQRKAEDTRLLYVAATRARDCLLLPLFQFPVGAKIQNENLFAGPLLKALEEKGAPVFWADAKETDASLGDPPAWVVPLDERPGKALDQEKEKLKVEQEARRKKLGSLRGAKQFKSVTSVLKVDADKQEREERVLEEPETSSPWGGKDLGSFAHLLLEKGWDWDDATLEKSADHYRQRMGVTPEQAELALDWVKKALQSDLVKRAKKSGQAFRELPITGRQEDGSYLNAVIDLAFLEDDQWVIVDYKTDQDPKRLEAKYKEQLGYYGTMLEAFTNKKVKATELLFLRKL
ncbi:MAG TPA: UvrD-helicase domain-containing protein [bacterium]|nr:UvrD-helicase domain-containing protein [bacterium]